MPRTIAEAAPAKINLALAVTGRRNDGYHLLDTVAVFADIGDRLTFEPASDLMLRVTGPFAGNLSDPSDNLVMRAAMMLRDAAFNGTAAPGAHIHLEKVLPVSSGIGGGAADAPAARRGLNRLWGLEWDAEQLIDLGVQLGADIPMCVVSRPLRATGIGEDIALLRRFPALPLVLVNPGVAVATAAVFSRLAGRFSKRLPGPARVDGLDAALTWLRRTGNDLEAPARSLAPAIDMALAVLRASSGCALARMSGSGATCFGLYADRDSAEAAARSIAAARPDWWVAATMTGTDG